MNDVRTSRSAWIVGTILAALAGVVAAPILGSISTTGYLTVTIVAAAAAVVGRLRSIPLTFVGGLGLGVIQDLVAGYVKVNISGFADSVPIVVLVVALLVMARDRSRRGGRRRTRRRRATTCPSFPCGGGPAPGFWPPSSSSATSSSWPTASGRDNCAGALPVDHLLVVRGGDGHGRYGQPGPGDLRHHGGSHHRTVDHAVQRALVLGHARSRW